MQGTGLEAASQSLTAVVAISEATKILLCTYSDFWGNNQAIMTAHKGIVLQRWDRQQMIWINRAELGDILGLLS